MSQPFKRYVMIRAAIQAAMVIGDVGKRIDALRAIPEYRSRGKGWKGKKQLAASNPQVHCNNAKVKPGTQGKRECARRVAQGLTSSPPRYKTIGPLCVWHNGAMLS